MLQDRKIYCLQACPCTIQLGHFTGWGSEVVKGCGLQKALHVAPLLFLQRCSMGPMLYFYFVFVFNTYLSVAGNSGRTAAAGAALPIPTSACSIFLCPNNGMATGVWDL